MSADEATKGDQPSNEEGSTLLKRIVDEGVRQLYAEHLTRANLRLEIYPDRLLLTDMSTGAYLFAYHFEPMGSFEEAWQILGGALKRLSADGVIRLG